MDTSTLQWRHNGRDGVSNHQPHDCLFSRLFRRRSKKTSKLRVDGLCEGISSVTGEFLAQRASNAENVSIWWRHHGYIVAVPLSRWLMPYVYTWLGCHFSSGVHSMQRTSRWTVLRDYWIRLEISLQWYWDKSHLSIYLHCIYICSHNFCRKFHDRHG